MISGAQYDTMLNFILTGSDKGKVKERTGNHTGSRAKTGQYGSDIMSNIFDLSSNVREWTSEANGTLYRTSRGGHCDTDNTDTADLRSNYTPSYTSYYIGSRLSLYIK